MKTIQLEELKVTINQLKRKARRERAKARKQEHAKRMEEYKAQMKIAQMVCVHTKHERIFRECQTKRSAKKFHNNVSSQQAGTLKPYTTIVRNGYTAITIKRTY